MDNISTYHKYTRKELENLVKYINTMLYIGVNYLAIILLISLL